MGRGPGGSHSGLVTLASIPLTSQHRPCLLPAERACHWADLWSTTRHEPLTEWQLWAPGPMPTVGPLSPTKLPPPRCSQLAGLADWVRAGCLAHRSQACPQTTRETRDQTEAMGPEKSLEGRPPPPSVSNSQLVLLRTILCPHTQLVSSMLYNYFVGGGSLQVAVRSFREGACPTHPGSPL